MTTSRTNTLESRRELGLSPPARTKLRLRHAAKLISSYWRSDQWLTAWALLLATIAFPFGSALLAVSLTDWEKLFFDALGARAVGAFPGLFFQLAILLAISAVVPLISGFLNQALSLRWRLWLTDQYMQRWLRHRAYFEIERARQIDNPDQRITEDVRLMTEQTLNLLVALLTSLFNAILFSIVLCKTSAAIRIAGFSIPGDIVWYGWGYAILGSLLVVFVGKPVVRRTMRQQHFEADLRYSLINVRMNAEQIAFLKAAPFQLAQLRVALANVGRNFWQLIFALLGLQTAQSVYGQLSRYFPLIVMLPRYLAGTATLGTMMQVRASFEKLHASLAIFVQVYAGIAALIATINRLEALDEAIEFPHPYQIDVMQHAGAGITTKDLKLTLPDGTDLLSIGDWRIAKGERWVIRGPSGAGKSTLLRALGGLWGTGGGTVELPSDGSLSFVPQRLFLPDGQLKNAICFPSDASAFDDAAVAACLVECRLEHLSDKLHSSEAWKDILSPGEQQRLAFARILLHAPDYLILDEATSALDPDNAVSMYKLLIASLPSLTLISVTHADALDHLHTHTLLVEEKQALQQRGGRNIHDG